MSFTAQAEFDVRYELFGTGVWGSILRPRTLVPGKAPVLYCHGTGTSMATGTQQIQAADTTTGVTAIAQALVGQGHVIVCPMLPNLWGKTSAAATAAAAIAYAQANLQAGTRVAAVGMSQGGAAMLRYMMTRTEIDWACGVGLIGATDLEDIRADDPSSQRAAVDAAYGVTYPAPLPAGVNPTEHPDAFDGIHLDWWGASNDGMVSSLAAETLMDAVEHGTYHDTGAQGHTDAAVLAVPPDHVVEYVAAHA